MAWASSFISRQQKIYYGGMLLLVMFLSLFFVPANVVVVVSMVVIALILGILFLFNIHWGLYAMAGFCFFSSWSVYLSSYAFTRAIPYIAAVDAPLIDFIALIVAVSMIAGSVLGTVRVQSAPLRRFARIGLVYGAFIAVALISALRAFDGNTALSLKYIARPLVFQVLMFVAVPLLLIRTKKLLFDVFHIWFWLGVVIAVFGLSSLVVVPQTGWRMVVPYGIYSVAPLGYNHNLIAEVLIALIPIGAILAWQAYHRRDERRVWLYVGGTGLMIVTELLTLSRAGWLSFAVQLGCGAYFFRSYGANVWRYVRDYVVVGGIGVVLALGVYMFNFLTGSAVVSSSNFARLKVAEITWYYVRHAPFLGYGPGMFIPVFQNTREYVAEFGEALDAHGVVQKITLETGGVGLFFFGAAIGYVMYELWRAAQRKDSGREYNAFLLVMVAGACVFQLFNTSYFSSVLWMPIGVALAGVYVAERNGHIDEMKQVI